VLEARIARAGLGLPSVSPLTPLGLPSVSPMFPRGLVQEYVARLGSGGLPFQEGPASGGEAALRGETGGDEERRGEALSEERRDGEPAQGYLAHKKTHPPRTLPYPMPSVLGGS